MKSDPVLITGVGKRVGLQLARNFLALGIPVIGTYRTEYASLRELTEHGANLHHCDLTDSVQLKHFRETITAKHGGLRAIIHNASEWLPDDAGLEPAEIMQRMIQIHVSTPYQLNLALMPLLQVNNHSHTDIIHIGDYVSSTGSSKHIAYAASKAAQDNLTLSFAALLAPKVKVNSIAPALILFNEDDDADYRSQALDKSLMQCEGGLKEIQLAVDYLLESTYVTGRILPVDGGRHVK